MNWASDIKTAMEEQVERYASIGHPSMMERFILRNGKPGISMPRPKKIEKQQDKHCFSNTANWILSRKGKGWTYVEGYALRPMLGMLMHHAWCENDKGHVLDLTWREPEHCQYYGVRFTNEELRQELIRNEVYGLLIPFDMYNDELMFRKDPGLKGIVQEIIRVRQPAAL